MLNTHFDIFTSKDVSDYELVKLASQGRIYSTKAKLTRNEAIKLLGEGEYPILAHYDGTVVISEEDLKLTNNQRWDKAQEICNSRGYGETVHGLYLKSEGE